jgi:hypothetical protein
MMQKSLGMESYTYNDKTFYGHAGGIDNFGSWLAYDPQEKLALAYTTNAKVFPIKELIDDVFLIYANKPFTIPDFDSMAISEEILDQYVGVYTRPEAPKFTIKRNGSTLVMQMADRPASPLEPITENKFKLHNTPIQIIFDVANKKMTMKRPAGEMVFTKEN